MRALKIDLEYNLNYLKDKDIKLNTVFIGGGTPSTVDASLYEDIFKLINPHILENCEITTEANPNSATKEWLEKMYSLGVNRVSFGVQSFDDEKLKFLGRNHNKLNAIKAIQNAKCIGFNSINCDIIYGVTNDTFELLKRDFDTLKELEVEHLSAYSLIIEEDTKFFLNEKELQKSKKSLKIDDEDFWRNINNGTYAFRDGDRLKVECEIRQYWENNNLVTKRRITKVLEILKRPTQIKLDFGN